jgi:TonB family protein
MAGSAAPGAAAISGAGTGGSGRSMAGCMDPAYLQAINRHVMHWYDYPMMARNSAISGVVYVHFVIDRSGHYQELSLAKGSGSNLLDDAAMHTMRRSEPLPPIPDRFHLDRLDGLMPIIYQLNGSPLTAKQLGTGPSGC